MTDKPDLGCGHSSLSPDSPTSVKTPTQPDLAALADRVEALDGPNYAIEVEIAERLWFINWGKKKPKDIKPPNYTSSIEAAMTLVPDGWLIEVSQFNQGTWRSTLRKRYPELAHATSQKARLDKGCGTSALALCAAALRALAQKGDA